ncbi:MAG: LiaF-related protein [Alkalibacterium sp.]|nr:LiaF-related protein [Alkalibacterium sp.]
MKENVLMIRKGFGDTSYLSRRCRLKLDVSVMLGKLIIEDEVFDMRNETVKWQSENYDSSLRKIRRSSRAR